MKGSLNEVLSTVPDQSRSTRPAFQISTRILYSAAQLLAVRQLK
jgi:hypothetical protein